MLLISTLWWKKTKEPCKTCGTPTTDFYFMRNYKVQPSELDVIHICKNCQKSQGFTRDIEEELIDYREFANLS